MRSVALRLQIAEVSIQSARDLSAGIERVVYDHFNSVGRLGNSQTRQGEYHAKNQTASSGRSRGANHGIAFLLVRNCPANRTVYGIQFSKSRIAVKRAR